MGPAETSQPSKAVSASLMPSSLASRPCRLLPLLPCASSPRPRAVVFSKSPTSADAATAQRVSELLIGTSVFVVGDSHAANVAFTAELASRLAYAPLHTSTLLEGLTGQSWADIEAEERAAGATGAGLALAEAQTLEALCTQGRVVVSTAGGGWGAAARGDCWRHLFGGVSVWLDGQPSATEAEAPQRGAYALAEVQISAAELDSLPASQLADQALVSLETLLTKDAKLTGKKSLYVRLGARGDWPELREPGP